MMRHVILEGDLGESYGRDWNMKAKSYSDIFECIEANYPGFRSHLIEKVYEGSSFTIQSGDKFIDEEELTLPLDKDTIIITAVPAGAKSGGAKILIGAALLAAVFFLPVLAPAAGAAGAGAAGAAGAGGAAAASSVSLAAAASATGASTATVIAANAAISVGLNLVLVGLQQMLAPDPSVDDNEQNYLFDGPEQTVVAGQPVPYLFGRKIISGVPISSSIIVGMIPYNTGYYRWPSIINGGGGGFNSGHIDYNFLFDSDSTNTENLDLSRVYSGII